MTIVISDERRRARLVARHRLGRTAADVVDAVRAVVAQHSSDPSTPYLAAWARVPGFAPGDLDRALLEDRTLWRLHCMRRTLFVVPAEDGRVVEAAAGREVAQRERRRLEGWLRDEVGAGDVRGFVAELEARVLEVLADGSEWRTQDLTTAVPALGTEITLGSGKWSTRSPLSSRLLIVMALDGRIVRTRAAGSWRSSQYHWAAVSSWFPGEVRPGLEPAEGRVELARRYLAAHGPATLEDLRWWTGWTVKQTRAALRELKLAKVGLEGGGEGLVLQGDEEDEESASEAGSVTLLPALDSTPMGWKGREWYLGDHAARLFDRNGNVGPTVWLDGRVVGGWGQRPDAEVTFELLEDIGAEASDRVGHEAAALTRWLDGTVVVPRFRTPLERELSTGATT